MFKRGPTISALCFFALLLGACASTPDVDAPSDAPASPTVIKPSSSSTETDADPVIASPPSIKPKIAAAESPAEISGTAASINIDNFPATLSLCPRMTISNAPLAGADRVIANYQPIAEIEGTQLAVAPVEAGCFSSGFGLRNGRRHKGIDIHSADPVNVLAAADGRVRERVYRDDYGNMLVIEHGDGVFARYAHLERFAPGIEIGGTVKSGQTIGVMGNTASYSIPRHLHYEILLGNYGTLTGSFGLLPVDIFDYLP
ncbi:MAG: M23 family metallopeptidase [Pseudomonadota bacterium]